MNKHIFLSNEKSTHPKFNRQRNVGGGTINVQESQDEVEETLPKIIEEYQKTNLRLIVCKYILYIVNLQNKKPPYLVV